MIRAIAIDDEQHCLDRLVNLLAAHCAASVQLMETLQSVKEGIRAIEKLRPELIFLDVQLHNQTAFDLLQQLDEINFDIIFTTAYQQYGVQAIKLSAIDYLLKPIDPEELTAAIDKLNRKKSGAERTRQLEVLFEQLKNPYGVLRNITVPTFNGFAVLSLSEIIRCQSEVNYTTFYMKDKPKLVVAKTLKEYEGMLSAHGFFRVHNSHLINLAFVKGYNKGKGGFVTMADGSEIEVSTRRKEAFLKKLTEG